MILDGKFIEALAESPRELVNRRRMFVTESTQGWLGSPMTAWIGGYRGSSIIRMKNDSEVST